MFTHITSILTLLITSAVFLFPSYAYAIPYPESRTERTFQAAPPVELPTSLNNTLRLQGIDMGSGSPLRDAASRVLSLGVCSGGNLTDRLKAVADGAVRAGVETGIGAISSWLTEGEGAGFIEDLAGSVLSSSVPIVGGLISGFLGLGGDKGPQTVTAPELETKDNCLDAIAKASSAEVLQHVTTGAIYWLTGVDPENPNAPPQAEAQFVYDLNTRFQELSDLAFQDIIGRVRGTGAFKNICDAFRSDVVIAMQRNYYRANPQGTSALSEELRPLLQNTEDNCGLEKVLADAEHDLPAFLSGEWESGSWEAWNALLYNNPYTSYLDASSELTKNISELREEELASYTANQGFLSDRRCVHNEQQREEALEIRQVDGQGTLSNSDDQYVWFDPAENREISVVRTRDGDVYHGDGARETAPCIRTEIFTPGSVIAHITNTLTTSDIRRAELSDEFNEIMADAGNLFISKVFRSGLRKATPGDVTGNSSVEGLIKSLRANIESELARIKKLEEMAQDMNEALTTKSLSELQFEVDQFYTPDSPLCGKGELNCEESTPSVRSIFGFTTAPSVNDLLSSANQCTGFSTANRGGVTIGLNGIASATSRIVSARAFLVELRDELDTFVVNPDPNSPGRNIPLDGTTITDIMPLQEEFIKFINDPTRAVSFNAERDLRGSFTAGVSSAIKLFKELESAGCVRLSSVSLTIEPVGSGATATEIGGKYLIQTDEFYRLKWSASYVGQDCTASTSGDEDQLKVSVTSESLQYTNTWSGLVGKTGSRIFYLDAPLLEDATFTFECRDSRSGTATYISDTLTITTTNKGDKSNTGPALALNTQSASGTYSGNTVSLNTGDSYIEPGYTLYSSRGAVLLSGTTTQTSGSYRVLASGVDILNNAITTMTPGTHTIIYTFQERSEADEIGGSSNPWITISTHRRTVSIIDSSVTASVTITTSPSTITSGGSTTLQWTLVGGIQSCTATSVSGAWGQSGITSSGSKTISLSTGSTSATDTFKLICSLPDGSTITDEVDVTVTPVKDPAPEA